MNREARLEDSLYKCRKKRELLEAEMKAMHDGVCSSRVCAGVLRDRDDEIRSLKTVHEPDEDDIDAISEAVGYQPGGWDMVDPAELIKCCWERFTQR